MVTKLKENAEQLKARTKKAIEVVNANDSLKPKEKKKQTKGLQMNSDVMQAWLNEVTIMVGEADWLYSKFGDGVYQDVLGLCKIASVNEIEEKNFSLTPGVYIGVAEVKEEEVDFVSRMENIHEELFRLNKEANGLMKEIVENLRGLNL